MVKINLLLCSFIFVCHINGQTTQQIKKAAEYIKNTGMSESQARSIAKSQGYSDTQIDKAIEKGKKENTVLEVFEKGYRYKDRVIRHAKVVVNQTPS